MLILLKKDKYMKFLHIYALITFGCVSTALQADILDTFTDTAQKYGVKALDLLPGTANQAYKILEDDFYKQLNTIKDSSSSVEAKSRAVGKAIDLSYQMLDVGESYLLRSARENDIDIEIQKIRDLQKNNNFDQMASAFRNIKKMLDARIDRGISFRF